MSTLSLILRLGLALVFAVAAGAKLADRAGTREAAIAFGAPDRAAGLLGVALPTAELVTATLLLPAAAAGAGGPAARGRRAGVSIAITVNLMRGRAPDCHCFGQLHSAPAGWGTLARNAWLAAAAGVVVAGGEAGPSAVMWLGRLRGSAVVIVVGAAIVIALAAAFLSLLRAYGRVLVRLDRVERALEEAGLSDVSLDVMPPAHGLAPGTPAPPFTLPDVSGVERSLADLLAAGRPLLLVFASAHCGPCHELMPVLVRWRRDYADRVTVAVASDGAPDGAVAGGAGTIEHVLLDDGGVVYDAFAANGTPGAVLIGADGVVASRVAAGRMEIEALLRDVLEAPGLPVGAPASELAFESLSGGMETLGAASERDTLTVFWNPDCGYCRALHPDLIAWERTAGEGGPRLVIVSSGDPERTRADGFQSSVLLDPGFTAGLAYGAGGTPAAVLLGADGRVASNVAAGAHAVLRLAHRITPVGVR
jgi:thiol-disulfide isomerase/thioredoxin